MPKIIGIDIGRDTATCAVLTEFPSSPLKSFVADKGRIKKIAADAKGVAWLLEQQPDGVVMEPTGRWYSAFWSELAAQYRIPVYWIGHSDLAAQRKSYGFRNKFDPEDAYCLALTYFDPRFVDSQGRPRWLQFSLEIDRVRQLFFELEQIDKAKNVAISQVRQRLCYEFPEVAQRSSPVSPKLGFSPLWGYLAGIYRYANIEASRSRSVSTQHGVEISDYTRRHALQLVELQQRSVALEGELRDCLQHSAFVPYLRVFREYGFGLRTQALMLIQCYPLSKFLVNGKPVQERVDRLSRQGRPTVVTMHRSLKSFQLYLGLGRTYKQSGGLETWTLGGSDITRSHLYCWVLCQILPPSRANYPLVVRLNQRGRDRDAWTLDDLRKQNIPGKSRVMRILFRVSRWLFYDLVRSVGSNS